ncbi:uncharacterized protein LOC117123275 [Anneissia japonica]|uniref:uncharacterized protein LOC117123275 n=1 Tax=Anneissia japonica TaxID=1529436 RepID=UPI00142579B5|nr:uncharacterized protein LOC117123275 [Anneissia japonica]
MTLAKACVLVLILAVGSECGSDLSTCGKVTAPLNPETFIVGGQAAQDGEWPWQAALFRAGRRICGASLIDPQWILTAAHCIDVVTVPSMFQFLMGTNSLRKQDYESSDRTQFINVTEVFVHPNYRPYRSDHDIALLKLENSFSITEYVRTVCIPTSTKTFKDDTLCTVTGWGTTEVGGSQNPDLFEVELPIVNQDECKRNYTSPITDDMICAGATGYDSCQGDSGGPMVTKVGENWVQVGVVSWGNGCGYESYPGVYARVTYFSEWIEPIFNNSVPSRLPGDKCNDEEFLCEGGYCIEYESKCDGSNTCYFDTDEKYCETYVRFFDYKKSKKLMISDDYEASSLDECAKICLEYEAYMCTQFDYLDTSGSKNCKLGNMSGMVEDSSDDGIMHFELQYFKQDGALFTGKSGSIASPRWSSSGPGGSWYSWTIQIASTSVNMIEFDFSVVYPNSEECGSVKNMLIVRAGNESNSKPVEASCVEMMEKVVMVVGREARIDFYTEDPDANGFLVSYSGVWLCDNTFTEEGKVTSPNYPENYPNGATCKTLIHAPEGMTIQLRMDDFSLEVDGFQIGVCDSNWDTLSIYDGSNDTSELYGEYCGSLINGTFVSSSNSMFLVFKSDSSIDEIPEWEKQIGSLNDSLNGYKFGLAALFVFCLLSIFVLSASLYTVTARETEMYIQYQDEKLKAPTRLIESEGNGIYRKSSNETQTPEGEVNQGFDAKNN